MPRPNELTRNNTMFEFQILVDERGRDYVYKKPENVDVDCTCAYVHGNEPGCLFGALFFRLGITLEELTQYEGSPVRELIDRLFPETNDRVKATFIQAQSMQDGGSQWGEVVAYIRGRFEGYEDANYYPGTI